MSPPPCQRTCEWDTRSGAPPAHPHSAGCIGHTQQITKDTLLFVFFPPIFFVFPLPFPKAKAVLLPALHPSLQDVSRAVWICCSGSNTEPEQTGKAVAGTSRFFKEKKNKPGDQESGVFPFKLPQNIPGSPGHPSAFEPQPRLITSQNRKANKQIKKPII